MRPFLLSALAILVAASPAKSDDPADPTPLIFTPAFSGKVCFCMVPRQYSDPGHKMVQDDYGVAYRLTPNGKLEELYRTHGWYSFKVYISDDGRYLGPK